MRFCGVLWICLLWTGAAVGQTPLDAPNEPTHHLEDREGANMDDAERDRQARDRFNQGRAAYEHGEYRDAWDYFRQAYVLSRRPALLYNVGQSADRLGLDEEALKAFRMYLRDAPEAENRREVENRIRALERRVQTHKEQANAAGEAGGEVEAGGSVDLLPPPPEETQPERAGWYYHGMLGLSLMQDSAQGGGAEATIRGAGVALDLAVGHPVMPEIVLGATMMLSLHSRPTRDDNTELDNAHLVLFGPYIDYYPAPLTGAWHFQGALAVGKLNMSRPGGVDVIGNQGGVAGAVVVGAVHEWRMQRELGIGVGGRLTLASATQSDIITHNVFVIAVGATATWY